MVLAKARPEVRAAVSWARADKLALWRLTNLRFRFSSSSPSGDILSTSALFYHVNLNSSPWRTHVAGWPKQIPSGGRMVQTGQFVHDYLGNPDMNMADIARGFGVAGEVVESPVKLVAALARARTHTVEGKPYLIDVQVARRGVGWSERPWVPPIRIAETRQKRV
jgi:hypothetical protein